MSFTGGFCGLSLADYIISAKSRDVRNVDVVVSEEKEEDWRNQRRYAIFFEERDGRRSWFSDRLSIDHVLFFDNLTAFNESYRAAVYLCKNGIQATFNGQPVDERLVKQKAI